MDGHDRSVLTATVTAIGDMLHVRCRSFCMHGMNGTLDSPAVSHTGLGGGTGCRRRIRIRMRRGARRTGGKRRWEPECNLAREAGARLVAGWAQLRTALSVGGVNCGNT